jgi:hypothetical protein
MSLFLITIVTTAVMAKTTPADLYQGPDDSSESGPEWSVMRSHTIVAGPVAHYSKVLKEGDDAFPVLWEVSGILEHPQVLKGQAPASAIAFRRTERTQYLSPIGPVSDWAVRLGFLEERDNVVLFLEPKTHEVILVLPSGKGERDLIAQIRLIVSIGALSPNRRRQAAAWREHLLDANVECQKLALRSLLRPPSDWKHLAAALGPAMQRGTPRFRKYAFWLLVEAIRKGRWKNTAGPGEFICTRLATETDSETAEQYRRLFDYLWSFATDETSAERRWPLRQQLEKCRPDAGARPQVEATP